MLGGPNPRRARPIQGQLDWRSVPAVIEWACSADDFYISNEDDQGIGMFVDVVDNSHYITEC